MTRACEKIFTRKHSYSFAYSYSSHQLHLKCLFGPNLEGALPKSLIPAIRKILYICVNIGTYWFSSNSKIFVYEWAVNPVGGEPTAVRGQSTAACR